MRKARGSGITGDDSQGKDAEQRLEVAAVRLLARREHGTQELKRKLAAKGHSPGAVEKVVEKLGAKRMVSDERFVSSSVRHHIARGHGPVRIRAELRQQAIADALIEQELAAAAPNWGQLAAEVRHRKFGDAKPKRQAERAKQARFLQYRGFTGDQIRAALTANVAGDADVVDAAEDLTDPTDQGWED